MGYTRLPPKTARPRMGVREPPRPEFRAHQRYVKGFGCCVPGCLVTPVDFAHLRSAANAGKGQKPLDIFGISLCRPHHDQQHRIGQKTFDRKHGIDSWALAAEFARTTSDQALREFLRERRVTV